MHQGHRHICLSFFIASLQLLNAFLKSFTLRIYVLNCKPLCLIDIYKFKVCAEIRTAEKDWISILFHSSSLFLKVALSQKVFHLGLNLPTKKLTNYSHEHFFFL